MIAILRQRNFGLLWFGQLISLAGDWVLFIALPFYVYQLTGSTLATGAMFIAQLLPSLLLGSVAGVFVDRWDRRRVMIASDVLRGLVLLLLLLVVRSTDWLWLIYLVAFAQSAIGQFFIPAKNAIIPHLVAEPDLVRANSLNAVSDSLTRLVGPSLGGLMFAALGLSSVVLVDAASFFVSAGMLALIALPVGRIQAGARPIQPLGAIWLSLWREWLAGLRFVRGDRILAPLFLVMGIFSLADAVFTTLLVAFASSVMHVGTPELGWLMAAQGLGGLLGGLAIGRLGGRISPQRWIALTCIADGLLLMLIFNVPVLALALALIFVAGVLMVGAMVSINTLLQTGAADSFRGRVFGAWLTSGGLMRLIGTLAAGSLAELVGVVPVLDTGALLWIMAGIMTLALLPGVVSAPIILGRTAGKVMKVEG